MWYALCVQHVCIESARCLSPFTQQGYKDPMLGNEHGNSMLTVKRSVIKLRNFGEELNLSPGVFVGANDVAETWTRPVCPG